MNTDEQVKLLQAAHKATLNQLLILEKVAADTLERARAVGDKETYTQAVRQQRAAHVVYDVINTDPDELDAAIDRQQPVVNAIRSGWIRWLINADDDMVSRFQENVTGILAIDDDLSDITPSA